MSTLLKNALAAAGIAVLAVFAVASLWYVSSYSKTVDPSAMRSFSVVGEGEVTAIPDVAQVQFTVLTEGGTDLQSLQDENAEKMNTAIAYVKEQGVEDKNIETRQYEIQPRYQRFNCVRESAGEPCPPPEIVGYTVRQTASVKIRDFSTIGPMLSGVVENGANSVSQLSFTLDDPEQAKTEARNKAIAQAQRKAEQIAEAGGFSVGRLLNIQENVASPYRPAPLGFGRTDDAIAEEAVTPSIEPGSQEVSVTVNLQYEIR